MPICEKLHSWARVFDSRRIVINDVRVLITGGVNFPLLNSMSQNNVLKGPKQVSSGQKQFIQLIMAIAAGWGLDGWMDGWCKLGWEHSMSTTQHTGNWVAQTWGLRRGEKGEREKKEGQMENLLMYTHPVTAPCSPFSTQGYSHKSDSTRPITLQLCRTDSAPGAAPVGTGIPPFTWGEARLEDLEGAGSGFCFVFSF